MGSFPEMCDDPFCSWMTGKSYAGHLEFHRIRAPASLWFFLVCSLAGCTLLLNFLLFFFSTGSCSSKVDSQKSKRTRQRQNLMR